MTTLRPPDPNAAPSDLDPDGERALDDLVAAVSGMVDGMRAIEAQAVALYTPEVNAILRSRSRDKHRIEHTLDHLLSFCGDDAALAVFKRLCRYYWDIDPAATAAHVYRYREWFGDEPESTVGSVEPQE